MQKQANQVFWSSSCSPFCSFRWLLLCDSLVYLSSINLIFLRSNMLKYSELRSKYTILAFIYFTNFRLLFLTYQTRCIGRHVRSSEQTVEISNTRSRSTIITSTTNIRHFLYHYFYISACRCLKSESWIVFSTSVDEVTSCEVRFGSRSMWLCLSWHHASARKR